MRAPKNPLDYNNRLIGRAFSTAETKKQKRRMANITCSDPDFASVDCHGNGNCELLSLGNLSKHMCNCSDGWTGRSDWINMEAYKGGNCHLNETGILVCWVILLTINFIALITSIKSFKAILEKEKKKAKRKKKGGGKKKKANNVRIYSILGIQTCFFGFFFALFKIIAGQDQLVGIDLPITLFYSFTRISFYAAVVYAQFAMLQLATGNAMVKNKAGLVRARKISLYKFIICDASIQLIPIISTFMDAGSSARETCYMALNISGGVGLAINFWGTLQMNKAIEAAFDGASEGRLKKIKDALAGTVKQAKKAAFINVPLFFSFAFIKKAWPFWSMMLPLQYV